MRGIQSLGKTILDAVFPQLCVGCGSLNTLLCSRCYEDISFFTGPFQYTPPEGKTLEIWPIANYQKPISSLIKTYKYRYIKDCGEVLGDLLFQAISIPIPNNPLIICPVPLHPQKQQERGFNQSIEIARILANYLGRVFPKIFYLELLTRNKHIAAQASIGSRLKRTQRMRKVFSLAKQGSFNNHQITQSTILLVDDVVTTGATLHACAKVLWSAGADKIIATTIAHEG